LRLCVRGAQLTADCGAAFSFRLGEKRPEIGDRRLEAFGERNSRFPVEPRSRQGDVGLPLLRIVRGKRLEDKFALRARLPQDFQREILDGELIRVPKNPRDFP
jgi:hypothetical protein